MGRRKGCKNKIKSEQLEKAEESKSYILKSWDEYPKTKSPHFKNIKEFLHACSVLKDENLHYFIICEVCEGIWVDHYATMCECGNWDEYKFKEITGETRARLEAGATLEDIEKYSYT